MSDYHVASSGGHSSGPYTLDELRSQQMAPDALVWKEGMTDWMPAAQMPELLPQLPVHAPAAHSRMTAAPPAMPLANASPGYAQPAYGHAPQNVPTAYQQPQMVNTVHVHAGPTMMAPVFIPTKSVGVAFLLTFLFGPLGMLYSTVAGGLVMLLVTPVFALFTLGLSLFVTWPICIIWACVAASSHNDRLVRQVRAY